MRSLSRIFLGTLLAVSASSIASAETPTPSPSIDPADFAAVTDIALDDAFEKTAAPGTESFIAMAGPSGPTTMNCSPLMMSNSTETCVVTARGNARSSMPAALANH